ncbi:uncharacterized protein ASCRUDRAFT_76318, partial [Ascoidea rubescens DSM 1968]
MAVDNRHTEFVKPSYINNQKDLNNIRLMLRSDNSILGLILNNLSVLHKKV